MKRIACNRVIKQLGFNIPNDISIVAFMDLSLAAQLEPKLTTVCVYPDKTGKIMSEHLGAIITESDKRGKVIHTPVKLIVRESTAVARKQP